VFVRCIEKAGLPGFGFSGPGEIGAWLSQRRLPKKRTANNCTSEDQKLAAECRIPNSREPKRKSRRRSFLSGPDTVARGSGRSVIERFPPSVGLSGTADSGYTPFETPSSDSTDIETRSFPVLRGPAQDTGRCCRSNAHRVGASALPSVLRQGVCDFSQVCCAADGREAILFFDKPDSR
jgi:hypothetical protein